jgi:2-polyprenyl-3-methyl-5-hydroxy-6-metoxy-1,4-benzoquinol methylase
MRIKQCRICNSSTKNLIEILDYKKVALAGSLLKKNQLKAEEKYPLKLVLCKKCKHLQINYLPKQDLLFKNYLWETGVSSQNISLITKLSKTIQHKKTITQKSKIIEIASNDGSLLKIFQKKFKCRVLGVDPAKNFSTQLKNKKIERITNYFSHKLSKTIHQEHGLFDICIARNVIAHLKDPNDIFRGVKNLLATNGLFIIEVPHLLNIFKYYQYDNVFHEHVGFHSLKSINDLSKLHGLHLFDVEEIDSQGGSIRCYISNGKKTVKNSVKKILRSEVSNKLFRKDSWLKFSKDVKNHNLKLRGLLTDLKSKGKKISVYGASGKGQSLLQFLELEYGFFDYIFDKSKIKQDLYSPGTHIKIKDPEFIHKTKPDYILVCAWNIINEISKEQKKYLARGGKFITPFPKPLIIS